MTALKDQTVTDAEGVEGRIVAVEPSADGVTILAMIEFAGGRHALTPQDMLMRRPDGSLHLSVSLATIATDDPASGGAGLEETRLPVVEERPVVRKEAVTRRVRVTKRVREREEIVDEPLLREEVEVERVPVGAWVEAPVPVRQDGDTTIIPVIEEVLFVEKRLRLLEEVRITKRRAEIRDPKTVTLRREEAVIEPVDGTPPESGTPSS